MKRQAIFLDRDGVINDVVVKNGKPYPPASPEAVILSSDVLPALQALKVRGYLLIGATNQPDVARGTTERRVVEAINAKLMAALPLDDIYVCYHDDCDQCICRKPLPGLLLQAAKKYGIDLTLSVMIGDRWKDIEAGQRAGCKTVWIDRSYAESIPEKAPDAAVKSLGEAAEWILASDAGPY